MNRVRHLVRHRAGSLDTTLFACALGVFLATRLVGLTSFPIYFFADEAIQTVTAADFVHAGFRDESGTLLPTYFNNEGFYNLSFLSVFAQMPLWALFGFSAYATRATSVAIALLGTAAVALILRDVFRVRFWWSGVLLLVITPAWFLHSRTAFETVLAVSLYAWFLYFYFRFLQGRDRGLYVALAFAACSFYTYRAIQPVVVLTVLVFVASNFRRHWEHRRHVAGAALLVLALAIPFARFELAHPGEASDRLHALGSYWARDDPFTSKLGNFLQEYGRGLDPLYWYSPHEDTDIVRHRMRGYGQIVALTAPFALLGALVCFRRIRSPAHRALLLAALAAPAGAALATVQITRLLVFVVPVTILTGIGLAMALSSVVRRMRYDVVAVALALVLTGAGVAMLADALENGPTWFRNYGLSGMQWGAPHVFREIDDYLRTSPDADIRLSPSWANGTNLIFRFFDPDPRVRLDSIVAYRTERLNIPARTVFVMTPEEYRLTVSDPRFARVRTERTLPYPDGSNGFYFVRLEYSPTADSIFAADRKARRQLVEQWAVLDGGKVRIGHSSFDTGKIRDLFDHDDETLVRTAGANPAVVELTFSVPRVIESVRVATGSLPLHLTVRLYPPTSKKPLIHSRKYLDLPLDAAVTAEFPQPVLVRKLRLEVEDIYAGEPAHIHIRDIALAP
jgi:hypothetical protein